jgi:phosphoribosylglycinamide formyltransferase-1
MGRTIRIGALISGTGTNLQAIIDSCESGQINGKIVFVGSDTPNARGLEKGTRLGIPTFVVDYGSIIRNFKKDPATVVLPDDFDLNDLISKQNFFGTHAETETVNAFIITRAVAEAKLIDEMRHYPFDLLVLAGYMRNLSPYFIDRINADSDIPRIMNIHPALLPAFPGVDGYGDTFRYGCKIGGCTVHFVDYGEDSGPIIGQKTYKILEDDTIDSIRSKGLKLEWALYPECVKLFAQGRLKTVCRSYQLKDGREMQRTIVRILPSSKD